MSWIRLDDQFADHPKIAAAGALAGWLHVKALVYCGRYLTDGFVPSAVALTLVDWSHEGLGPDALQTPVTNDALVARLCGAGLWEQVQGGYQIHDFLDWNPSAEKVKAERAAEKARKAAGRANQTRDPSTGKLQSPPSGQCPEVVRPESDRTAGGRGPETPNVPPVPSPSPSPSPLDNKTKPRTATPLRSVGGPGAPSAIGALLPSNVTSRRQGGE